MSGSVGEQLKQARLERGVSLDQAAQATRIRKHYLEALEDDQRSLLPSAVQGKGFLRLYSGYLNLPVESLLALWDGKTTGAQAPAAKPAAPAFRPAEKDLPEPAEEETPPDQESQQQVIILEQEAAAGTGSHSIFEEIGVQLRLQRESLGLSLAEVERYTRLRQRYIQAMEAGKLENMPSPVQARGMLSNYAAFLNMDEDKILLRFAEGLQLRRIERIPKLPQPGAFTGKQKPARHAPFWRRFLTPDLVFGVGLGFIILFFIIWTAARIDTLRGSDQEPTTPAISEVLLTPDAFQLTASPPVQPLDQTVVAGEMLEETVPAGTDTGPAAVDTSPIQAGTTTPLANATPTLLPINDDPLQIYIIAHQRAWLRVTADDKVKFLGRVVPGNAYAFSGERRIELLTGNAAGLQVFYNQNDLGTLGVSGEVTGLIFSSEGITTATLAVPPTRTPAAEPSITPLPSSTPQPTPTVTLLVP